MSTLIKSGAVKYNPSSVEYAFDLAKTSTPLKSTMLGRTIDIGSQALIDIGRIGKLRVNDFMLIDNAKSISFENEVVIDTIMINSGSNEESELLTQKIVSLFSQSVYEPFVTEMHNHPSIKGKTSPFGTNMATVVQFEKNDKVKVIREMIIELRSLSDPEDESLITYVKFKVTIEGKKESFINQKVDQLRIYALQTAETPQLEKAKNATYSTNRLFGSNMDMQTYI